MQVHQIFDLCLGVAMVVLGVIGIGRGIYRALTHTFPGRYDDWRVLGASIFFGADGLAHCSKAFDLPHHESHRTAVLILIALSIMYAVIAASVAAEVVIRRRKKTRQTVTDATRSAA
jgi:hypothetical protein